MTEHQLSFCEAYRSGQFCHLFMKFSRCHTFIHDSARESSWETTGRTLIVGLRELFASSSSCKSAPHISPCAGALCHFRGDQLSSLAQPGFLPWVPADKSLSWLCVNHLPLPYAPLSGWSSPLYPGLHPIQPGQGPHLYREPWHGAQYLLESSLREVE